MKKEFTLKPESAYVTLQQVLKFEGIAYSGGSVKAYLENYLVMVNDIPETRRGRKLYPGDEIVLEEPELTILVIEN